MLAMTIFATSMVLLYAASTIYHSICHVSTKVLRNFQKLDHMMIFVLIAGSYTPVCMIILGGRIGYTLLALVWGIAVAGIIVKGLWITCPKWFSSIIYIAMGWTCLPVFARLWTDLPHAAFGWLLAGGIIYTIGGVIYALKLPVFNALHKYFGSHEIFHLFVIGWKCLSLYLYVSLCNMIIYFLSLFAGLPANSNYCVNNSLLFFPFRSQRYTFILFMCVPPSG